MHGNGKTSTLHRDHYSDMVDDALSDLKKEVTMNLRMQSRFSIEFIGNYCGNNVKLADGKDWPSCNILSNYVCAIALFRV